MADHQTKVEAERNFLTASEVAKALKLSRSLVHKRWKKWLKHGVHPIRLNGSKRGRLLFRREEIEKLLEIWRIA